MFHQHSPLSPALHSHNISKNKLSLQSEFYWIFSHFPRRKMSIENWVCSPILKSSSLLEQISLADFLFCVISGAVTTPSLTWAVNLHTGLSGVIECSSSLSVLGAWWTTSTSTFSHHWSVISSLIWSVWNSPMMAVEDWETLKHVNVMAVEGFMFPACFR